MLKGFLVKGCNINLNRLFGRQASGGGTIRQGLRHRKCRLEPLEHRQLLAGDLLITELVAESDGSVRDRDGDAEDWIEIHNPTDQTINLLGWHLTDDADQPTRWEFPYFELQAGGHAVVFASGKDRAEDPFAVRRDFNSTADATFLVDLPEGTYDVRVTLGDDQRARDEMAIYLQGTFIETLSADAGRYVSKTYAATVDAASGGQLALRLEDRGGVTGLATINGLIITPQGGGDPRHFDFGTASSPVQAGFTGVLPTHNYTAVRGYGWSAAVAPNAQDRGLDFDELHTNFKLGAGGEYLALSDPSGAVVHEYAPGFPAQRLGFSYGLQPSEPGEMPVVGYFADLTPGAANTSEVLTGLVGVPNVSIEGGFFAAAFDVAVSLATPGATLVYTIDGSTPSLEHGTQVPAPDAVTPPSASLHIDRNTLLRVAAFHEGLVPSPVVTNSYLFVDHILQQSEQSALDAGFPEFWTPSIPGISSGTTGDYGLDPDVIGPNDLFDGEFTAQMADSLKSLPSLSIVTDLDNLFGPELGIYVWSNRRDPQWEAMGLPSERPISLELLNPDGSQEFQIDAGIKIQGDNSRSHSNAKKHSFRLLFKQQYGAAKLDYPFFGDEATDQFDQIVLRANYNDGWVHSPWSTQHIRDQWARATQLDMGNVAAHGNFVHVYLNGFYWGVYNAIEHPEASFSADYFGGDKEEWDAVDTGRPVDGTLDAWRDLVSLSSNVSPSDQTQSNTKFQEILGNNPDGSDNASLETMLDVNNYIDYLIMNFYGGNVDWPGRNWYATRQRGPESTGFKFFSWDTEKIIDHGEGSHLFTNQLNANEGVGFPYSKLRFNDEFRLMFADRVQKHFFNGGALYVDPQNPAWDPDHPESNQPADRYDEIARAFELALVAESARWGDVEGGPRQVYRAEPQFIENASAAKYLVPQGAAGETGWQNPGFDDSLWNSGQAAVGYDTGVADLSIGSGFRVEQAYSTGIIDSLAAADGLLAGEGVARRTELTGVPAINYTERYPGLDPDPSPGDRFKGSTLFPLGIGDNSAVRATATITVNVAGQYSFGVNTDDGARLRVDGVDVLRDDTLDELKDSYGTVFLSAGEHVLELVSFDATGVAGLELFFVRAAGQIAPDEYGLLSTNMNPALTPWIQTDVASQLQDAATSLYLRIPFDVSDPTDMDRLMLHTRYDDGFIAYLNGQEVARRNVAADVTHESTSTHGRHDPNSVVERSIELTIFQHLIQAGENVLAVHVLNASADDPDLLFAPRLEPLLSREYTSRDWRAVRDSIFDNYFPQRSEIVLDQFRAAGLYVDGPQLSQHGGDIDEGFELSMTGIGRIYYSTDGSDPRISTFGREAEGTAVSPSAVLFTGPLALQGNKVVKARSFIQAGDMDLSGDLSVDDIAPLVQALANPSAYRASHFGIPANFAGDLDGDSDFDFDDVNVFRSLLDGTGEAAEPGQWTALVEAAFSSGPPEVRVSEIMYHPEAPPAGSSFEDNDFEYIELVNVSDTEVDLGGLRFTQGVGFEFAAATLLAPGERIVVVRDVTAFQERYGTDIRVAGQYGGTAEDYKLSNGGETLRLEDARGRVIQEFAYDDAWYGQTDGDGFSLEVVDPFHLPVDQWGIRENWRASPTRGGSPGQP